jgi:DNA-binding transcriptional regulator YbjK
MERKPNAEERRRELCDAAIELLAEEGAPSDGISS